MDADEFVEKLILEGVVEVSGINSKTGEFMYGFTDKLQELYPELYQRSLQFFNKFIMDLWTLGFLKMDITEQNPKVSLTLKAFQEEELSTLDDELAHTLNIIKTAMQKETDV